MREIGVALDALRRKIKVGFYGDELLVLGEVLQLAHEIVDEGLQAGEYDTDAERLVLEGELAGIRRLHRRLYLAAGQLNKLAITAPDAAEEIH